MMRHLPSKYLWLIILNLNFSSCKEQNKKNDALVIGFNDEHQIKRVLGKDGSLLKSYQINLVGQKDGYSYEYFKNKRVKSISYYKYDILDSVQSWYYPSGLRQGRIYRLDGKKFGSQNMYDSTGNLEEIYFVSSECDSCVTSILSFYPNGSIKGKEGSIIHCVYESENIHIGDTAKLIFYVIQPEFFKISATLVETNLGSSAIRSNCKLDFFNNNKGFLFIKKIETAGNYKVGLVVNILNTKTLTTLSDSLFISLRVSL